MAGKHIRFFRTPAQVTYHDTKCWRLCGADKANHFHVFWSCPSISGYWREVKKGMDNVLNVNVPLNFKALYLQDVGTSKCTE